MPALGQDVREARRGRNRHMSCTDHMEKCPMCGELLTFSEFQLATVWKDNKKRELFVCRSCASKAKRKRRR